MPNCRLIDPLVTPYVDGELAGADRDVVTEHLQVCAPCCARVAAEQAVHDIIRARRSALDTVRAPESLRATCAALTAGTTTEAGRPPSRRWRFPEASRRERADGTFRSAATAPSAWRGRLAPLALAASLVLVVGGAFLYVLTEKSSRVLAAELTADHVKCFAMNNVFGTKQAAPVVESSMISGFGWQMHLPDNPAGAGLELVGARPCLYAEGKIAHIMYKHEGRAVSLFMLPNADRSRELVRVLGHEAAIWCVGNRTFVLIAREPRQDVERMASFVQASLR